MSIHTKRLMLVQGTVAHFKAALQGESELALLLNVSIEKQWTQFGVGGFQYALDRIQENPESNGWWAYFPIHKVDQRLIGSGGYKGNPNNEGEVEIGYEIAPAYRGQGLATEMAAALTQFALRDAQVRKVVAHTLGHDNPSTTVLKKCGFKKTSEITDPDDGIIWRWELTN